MCSNRLGLLVTVQGMDALVQIYIYKLKSHPSVCPSVTPITRLGLLVSTHQMSNTKHSSSACSKFVTASSCLLPFALQGELNEKVLSYILLKTTTQPVERGHGFKSSWWHDFFSFSILFTFCYQTFSSLYLSIQSTYQCVILAKLHALHLATRIILQQIDVWFCSFFIAC